jgi:hypothetical protein
MLGGEREAPPMIRAQRDMIELELKYYGDEVYKLFLISCIALTIILPSYIFYIKAYNV